MLFFARALLLGAVLASSGAIWALPAEPEDEDDGPEQILERVRHYVIRHGEGGRIDPVQRLEQVRQDYQRRRSIHPLTIGLDTWVSIGPTNGAGRMTALAPHPTAAGTLYAGAADGGAWKTTDTGVTWTPLTDALSDLSVGALALAPSDPNVVYLGSGEGGYAFDFIPGIGFLKSTNGGSSWILPASVVATQFFRISVHPTNPLELVVGTNNGGFRSTDGGTNFTSVIANATYRNVTDVVRHPTDPSILYAATWCGFACASSASRVLKSTDFGATWADKSVGLPVTVPDPLYERLSLAMAPTSPLILFASTSIKAAPASAVAHIYKTTDGGDSWTDLPGMSGVSPLNTFFADQSWYNNTTVVSPTNASIVTVGGTAYVRTTDGGTTWGNVGGGAHTDVHELRYQGSTLFVANDGGIYSSTDNLTTATPRNIGLVTRQFYTVAIDSANPNRVLAGAQDNGTVLRQDAGGTTWAPAVSGDGFDTALSGTFGYATIQNGLLRRSTNVGAAAPTWGIITPAYAGADASALPFLTVLTMDPTTPTTLYTGSYRVWRTTDGGVALPTTPTWAALPTTTTDGSTWSTSTTINTVAVARANSQILVATKFASLFRSTDGGTTWALKTTGLPAGTNINNIEIDPLDPTGSVMYVALARTTGNSVYRTTNGGTSWTIRATGLPNFAAQVVRVDPTDSNDLFVGTDVGVYRSTNAGASWAIFGNGLPASSAQDIRISDDGTLVRLGTHGRGAWELRAGATATAGFYSVVPCRVADTRNAAGPYGAPALAANAVRVFTLSGQCGIPSDAKVAVANIAVVNPGASGVLKIFALGSPTPTATAISFAAGRVQSNNAL
ncbi:MAG: hypothetical protein ABIT01_16600, partial [Thermoanaerobaculia bacterium]